jgi:glutamate-1-semialdehyde 2,1-aminomutase
MFMATESSSTLRERAHRAIPAGCHTYSKGDDQFPSNAPAFIESAHGCIARDPAGNEYLDWGMGLRSVILGHAYPRVVDAVAAELRRGSNFTRPSPIETVLAEELIDLVPCAEMVKLAKNGSDVTTAAVRLARAATGRDLVALPREHPFYSFDDWFIGTTVVDAGVPEATKRLSHTFAYGDVADLEGLFARLPGQIAAVIMEAATTAPPPTGYLEAVRELTRREGAVLIFDEMITGFRWHESGAQSYYGVIPDMATFGKGIGNGFSVSALVGRREIMELGGLRHDQARVFLLSATHGGETHAIAAALATIAEVRERRVVEHIWTVGERLQRGLAAAAADAGLSGFIACAGYPCSPTLRFSAGRGARCDAELRTLFLQGMVEAGILIPYIAPSFSHGEAEVDRTVEAAARALEPVRQVLDGAPIEQHLVGPPVQPVFRRFNAVELDA